MPRPQAAGHRYIAYSSPTTGSPSRPGPTAAKPSTDRSSVASSVLRSPDPLSVSCHHRSRVAIDSPSSTSSGISPR